MAQGHSVAGADARTYFDSVVNAVSVTEVYVDGLLGALVNAEVAKENQYVRALREDLGEKMFTTWSSRLGWLGRAFEVSIAGSDAQQEMFTVIEVRNAVVHGHGKLTRRQSATLQGVLDLERAFWDVCKVNVSGGVLSATDRTAAVVASVSARFIRQLDAAAALKHVWLSGVVI